MHMLNWRAALLALAAAICLGCSARADIGEVSYGPWSEWGDQTIENRTDLFVETRQVSTPILRRTWRYTRYHVQGKDGTRFAATDAGLPGAEKETSDFTQPLEKLGLRDGYAVYRDEWFNELEMISVDSLESRTQYRARAIYLEACEIEPASLIVEAGEHVALGIRLLDTGAYSLTSDKPEVVSVTQAGRIAALTPGRARITLIYKDQSATCDVLVIAQREEGKEGAAALRLFGTRLTVRYDADKKEVTGLKLTEEALGGKADPEMRFLITGVDYDCFSLRALCPRIGYLAAPLKEDGNLEEGQAQVLLLKQILDRQKEIDRLKEAAAQTGTEKASGDQTEDSDSGEYADFAKENDATYRFRAIKTPEGSLILCLQADNSYALAASSAEANAGLTIEKLNLDDPLQRWTLEPEKGDVTKNLIWRLPVQDNSFCQITDDFKTMARDNDKHDGVDFSPTSNKDVLSVSAGRVVRVDDRCTHDYRKTKKNKYGRYIDPCDLEDGIVSKYGSYGKYVVIEHEDGTQSMYAHLSKIRVRSGQKVKQGQVIGVMGSTGSANGTHLHFEIRINGRAVDPRYYLVLPEIGGYVP